MEVASFQIESFWLATTVSRDVFVSLRAGRVDAACLRY